MWLVVFGHIGCSFPLRNNGTLYFREIMQMLCFFIPFHVNLFILISGYCGIKSIKKSLMKLWGLLLSYLILISIFTYFLKQKIDPLALIFPLSHNPWWFMRTYVLLSIVAPVTEVLLKNQNEYNWRKLIAVFLIIDIYAGFICQIPNLDHDGYDLIHFITIYLTGRYLSRFNVKKLSLGKFVLTKNHFLILFFIVAIIKLLCHLVLKYLEIEDRYMDYNNPFNYLLSICAFLYLINLNIHRKGILFISSSAIGVYLITSHPYIEVFLMEKYIWILNLLQENTAIEFLYTFLFINSIFICCIFVDKIRLLIMNQINIFFKFIGSNLKKL